jgi:hypothetical protein
VGSVWQSHPHHDLAVLDARHESRQVVHEEDGAQERVVDAEELDVLLDPPLALEVVTPRTDLFTPRIPTLNESDRAIAAETGTTYVDLWPALATGPHEQGVHPGQTSTCSPPATGRGRAS